MLYRSIDLFAGIGGIRMGFDSAFGKSIETVFVCEWDEFAKKTYRENFCDTFEIAGDIVSVDEKSIPAFDICLARFPCQAFSIAGTGGYGRQGFNDDFKGRNRGKLFLEVVRICEHHKPKVIFCENVKGLVTHDKGNTFRVICQTFRNIGYQVFWKILNSKDFGVPQNRERVYIVAFREDLNIGEFVFPVGSHENVCIRDILQDAPIPAKYYLSDVCLKYIREHKARHQAKGHGFGYVIRDLDGIAGTIACSDDFRNVIIDSRPHSTVPETHTKGSVNSEDIRKMTPREYARLQGFPDSFKLNLADTHHYKQFGNSVTVSVIKAIANGIRNVLYAHKQKKGDCF